MRLVDSVTIFLTFFFPLSFTLTDESFNSREKPTKKIRSVNMYVNKAQPIHAVKNDTNKIKR